MRLLLTRNLMLSSLAIVMVVGGFTPARHAERVLAAERVDIVDSTGRPMLVLAHGARHVRRTPRLQFLDERGAVVAAYPR